MLYIYIYTQVYGQDDEGKGPLDRDMGQRMYQCSDNKWIVVACLQVRQGMRFVREVLEIPHQDGDFSSDTVSKMFFFCKFNDIYIYLFSNTCISSYYIYIY